MSQRVNKARGGLALSLPLPLSRGGIWAGLPEPRAGRVRSEGKSFDVETTGFWGDPADSAPPGRVGWLPSVYSRGAFAFLSPVCTLRPSDFGQRDF